MTFSVNRVNGLCGCLVDELDDDEEVDVMWVAVVGGN